MPPKWLMCPQCGAILFYVRTESGTNLFFKVNPERNLVPTREEFEQVVGLQPEQINCASCSWKGPVRKLKDRFIGL